MELIEKLNSAANGGHYPRTLAAEAADEIAALRKCLIQFARIWAMTEQLGPDPSDGIRGHCAGLWPTMADAKQAYDLVWKHRQDGE